MSSIRDRLRALGIDESRLQNIGLGAPALPAVDEALVADLAKTSGKSPADVRAALQKHAAAETEPQRALAARAYAQHVEIGPYADGELAAIAEVQRLAVDREAKSQFRKAADAVRARREYKSASNAFERAWVRQRYGSDALELGRALDDDNNDPPKSAA